MLLLSTYLLENKKFIDTNNMKMMKFIGYKQYNNEEHLVFSYINKIRKTKSKNMMKIIADVNVIYSSNMFNKLINENKIICV